MSFMVEIIYPSGDASDSQKGTPMNVASFLKSDLDLNQGSFLVVETKAHFREIAHNALMRGRARDVKYAPDVDEAMQVLKRLGPQLTAVICDWDIAPVGGLELLRNIRSGKSARIPRDLCVVILTSKTEAIAVKAAMQLDVNGFATEGRAIREAFARRDFPTMFAAVSEEMIDTMGVAGTADDVRVGLTRYEGVLDHIMLYSPSVGIAPERVQQNLESLIRECSPRRIAHAAQ